MVQRQFCLIWPQLEYSCFGRRDLPGIGENLLLVQKIQLAARPVAATHALRIELVLVTTILNQGVINVGNGQARGNGEREACLGVVRDDIR